MSKAIIRWYDIEVEFDPIDVNSNAYDLYEIAIVDPDNEYTIVGEECYADEDEYRSALQNTYGREVIHEQERVDTCEVIDGWGETYECDCTHHVAYVIDEED